MSPSPTFFLGQAYALVETTDCASEAETLDFALRLAAHFRPGDSIALTGDLGAGKTTWVRGLAQSLRLEQSVHSPTYGLIHSYGEPPRLHHLDLYRLAPGTDWNELGLDDIFNSDALICIEWPQRMPDGTRFQHWIDIHFGNEEGDLSNSRGENLSEFFQADTRVIRWYRLLEQIKV